MSKEKKVEYIIWMFVYFESDDFDCFCEYLLNEIVCCVWYWFKRIDGLYNIVYDDS